MSGKVEKGHYQGLIEFYNAERKELEPLFHSIVEQATALLRAKGGRLYLYDEKRKEARCVVSHNVKADRPGVTLKPGQGAAGRVIQTGEPLIINDYQSWKGRSPSSAARFLTAVVSVPLEAMDRIVGVLSITTDEKDRIFNEEDLRLATLFANQAAIAMENARLYREERRRARQEAALAAVGRALSPSLEVEDLLQKVLNELLQALELDLGAVYLLQGDEFLLLTHKGLSPKFAKAAGRNPKDHHILGQVIQSQKPLEVRDFACPETGNEGIKRAAYVPLVIQEKPLGILVIGDRAGRALTAQELEILETASLQLGLALGQAEFYQETIKLREKYQSMVENELVGVYIIQDGKLKYVNEGFCKISGYTKEELLHASPLRLVHPEDRKLICRNIEKRLRGESLAHSYTFRGLRKDGQPLELEVFARRIEYEGRPAIHGMLVDITFLRETEQLRRDLLEVAEEILASHDVERILRRVVQAVVDHSPFQRAAIALYDLKHEPPLEGPLVKAVAVGLTAEEEERLYQSGGLTPEQRKQAFGATFQVSNSYYIPHDRVPWEPGLGVPGRVSLDGWHPEDFLFIPLRGGRGIIGHISVDDPRIPQAVNVDVLEPMEVFAGLAALAVERAARMEELKRHQEWLHGSYRIGQQLTRYRSLKGLLNGILEILKRELHYDYGAVMLQQGHQLAVEAVETTFADRRIDLGDRIPLEQGITGWVGRHRKPALVNDVTQDPRYVMGHQEIRSELAVPIQLGDEFWGVLNMESTERNRFKVEDQEFLSSVAAQLAVALAEFRSRQQLERAYRIGQELVEIDAKEELISLVLNWLQGQFRYDYGTVLLKEEGQLRLAGYTIKEGAPVSRKEIELGKGIIGWAGEQRQSALVNDVREDPRYVAGWEGVRSELAVPIHTPEELFGVLDIQSEQPGYFTEENRQVLESIAGQMAIALSNIERREKLKEASIRDPLTGLYNRRYFNEIIERELERSRRYKHYLTLLMIDLDNFRRVNNAYGHRKGDEVLNQIAQLLSSNVRASDMAFRYGGDEFLILMPETDNEAAKVVERLEEAIKVWNKESDLDCQIDLSIGVSSWSPQEERRIEEVLEEADQRMYRAKNTKAH